MTKTLAYLGPEATFCEQAARSYICNELWELLPYPSIEAVFSAVHQEKVDSGMVPIENSCEGSVNQTLDLLAYDYDLKISGEIVLPVKQNLLARPGVRIEEISQVLSHSQALSQCRKYLSNYFPEIKLIDMNSTAQAAQTVAKSYEPWAAIGTTEAALSYGLIILSPEIQDRVNNETRFITLSKETTTCVSRDAPPQKTSLLINLLNKPGALFKALEQFYLNDINLNKIESRPSQTGIGNYLFFIDIEGNYMDPPVRRALNGLQIIAHNVRILGSYTGAR